MRVGYVFVPHFSVQVERIFRGGLDDKPLVIGGSPCEKGPVYDASAEAIASGVTIGMSLKQASVLCPEAYFLPSSEGLYREMFAKVLGLLERFSPLLEAEGVGCIYFDAGGMPDERKLAVKIADAIHGEIGLKSQLGIASNKFVARTAAMLATLNGSIIVSSGGEAAFLSPLKIDILPCSLETRERLYLFGIKLVGELAAFNKEALVSQFGKEGELLYNLAHGIDYTPLLPRRTPEVLVKTVHLDVPVNRLSELTAIVKKVAEDTAQSLGERRQVCRKISVRLISSSGVAVEETFSLKQPTSSPEKMLLRLNAGLLRLKLPKDIEEIELSFEVGMDWGSQLKLLNDAKRGAPDEVWKRFAGQTLCKGLKKVKVRDPEALLPEERYRLIDLEPDRL